MKHPPPWWLRLPIYLDWIQSSFVVIVLATLLAHGQGGHRAAQSLVIIAAASLLIVLDLLVGLGYWWTLLPRAGLALAALVLCGRTIHWDPIRPEEWILVAIGIQQLWVLLACLAAEVRLRLHSKRWGS